MRTMTVTPQILDKPSHNCHGAVTPMNRLVNDTMINDIMQAADAAEARTISGD